MLRHLKHSTHSSRRKSQHKTQAAEAPSSHSGSNKLDHTKCLKKKKTAAKPATHFTCITQLGCITINFQYAETTHAISIQILSSSQLEKNKHAFQMCCSDHGTTPIISVTCTKTFDSEAARIWPRSILTSLREAGRDETRYGSGTDHAGKEQTSIFLSQFCSSLKYSQFLSFATLQSFNSLLNIFYKSPCVLHVLAITSSSSLLLLAHNRWVLGASSHTFLLHLSSPDISDLTPYMAPRAAPLWTSRALSETWPSLSTSGHPSSLGTLRLKALVQGTCVNPTNAVFPSFCTKTAHSSRTKRASHVRVAVYGQREMSNKKEGGKMLLRLEKKRKETEKFFSSCISKQDAGAAVLKFFCFTGWTLNHVARAKDWKCFCSL